jgi:exopolysaccharide biosynthesis predicted pyruvyltransferase EpsI
MEFASNNYKVTHDFGLLIQFLSSLEGREVLYFRNPGNAGDAIIDLGFSILAQRSGLTFRQPVNKTVPSGSDVVLYGGGGNLVQYWRYTKRFIQKNARNCNLLVLLPHTVNGHEALLSTLPSHVHIWAREMTSYEYLKGIVPHPENIFLAHDMAFALAGTELLKSVSQSHCDQPLGHAFAFRIDKEQNGDRPSLPSCNEDLSLTCGGVGMSSSQEQVLYVSTRFLQAIHCAEVIYTDRLHIAIAGSLLDKRVHVFACSYYKVMAIYQHSIEERFPHTIWHPDFSNFPLADCGKSQGVTGACTLGSV